MGNKFFDKLFSIYDKIITPNTAYIVRDDNNNVLMTLILIELIMCCTRTNKYLYGASNPSNFFSSII